MSGNAAAVLLSGILVLAGVGLAFLGLVIGLIGRRLDTGDDDPPADNLRTPREASRSLLKVGGALILGGFLFGGAVRLLEMGLS